MKSPMWYSRHYFHFVVILSISLHTLRNVLNESVHRIPWTDGAENPIEARLHWVSMTDTCYVDLMEQRPLFIGQEALNTSFWVLTWHFAEFLQEFTRALCALFALERKKSDFSLDTGISITVVCFIIMPGSTDSQYDCANSQRIRTMQHMSTNWNLSLIREASFKITLSLSPHFPVEIFPRFLSSLFVPGSILMRFYLIWQPSQLICHTKCIRHN